MFKALRDSLEANPYNQAIDHFQKLRQLDPSGPAYSATLLKVISRCQLAIQKRRAHGDAHVLLANAYLMAALSFPYGDVYQYALVRCAAVIQHCMIDPMFIGEQEIGSKILNKVEDELEKGRPSWAGESPPNDIAELHEAYYGKALNYSSVEELSDLLAQER
jgi:hypothetical protein